MRQVEPVGVQNSGPLGAPKRGPSYKADHPGNGLKHLLLTAITFCTVLCIAELPAAPATTQGTEAASAPDTTQPEGKLTHAQRFERSPGVLGVSIRTLRKAQIKGYANESVGYLALDFEDINLTPKRKGDGLKLNLAERLQFASRKDDVPDDAKPVLDGVARVLVDNPDYLIQVVAHTDDRGDSGYNMRLSQRRADAVKTYLVERGIEEVRLIALGLGETEPLAPAKGRRPTRAERAQNRRVELLIEPMALPTPDTGTQDVATEQAAASSAGARR